MRIFEIVGREVQFEEVWIEGEYYLIIPRGLPYEEKQGMRGLIGYLLKWGKLERSGNLGRLGLYRVPGEKPPHRPDSTSKFD